MNEELIRYLSSAINEINGMYPDNPIGIEAQSQILNQLQSSGKPLPVLKKEIDAMKQATIEGRKAKEESAKPSIENDTNREAQNFEDIKKALSKLQTLTRFLDAPMYISGGIVPYLLLGQDSGRLHDDIDTIVDLKDIHELRKVFKDTPYYNADWDSLNHVQDGNDYGFELNVDGVPVGIYPFIDDDDTILQYTYDPYTHECKIKRIPEKKKENYVKTYTSTTGEVYTTMSLEYIKKSKDIAGRGKDIKDSAKIDEYGYDEDLYSTIELPDNMEFQKETAERINETISHDTVVRNSIVRFSYIAKKKYGKELTDDKISEAVDRLKDKSYDEIDGLLVKGIENIKTVREVEQMGEEKVESAPPNIKTNFGYVTAVSTGYIFVIFGIIVCIAAILFKIILGI